MEHKDIHVGKHYALRDPARAGEPFQRVKVIERARTKWQVEWIEPNKGLTDYVRSNNLIVAWSERKPFLRDERRTEELRATCARMWPGHDHPLGDAVDTVLEATGEGQLWVDNYGVLSAAPDALERLATRARFELPDDRPAFVDRHGQAHHPFETAVALAQAFAAAEPHAVTLHVDLTERRYATEARELGGAYLLPLLQRWRAGWALCRQWAGFDEALAERDAEIERLRRIIDDLRSDLRRTDQIDLATKLDRKLKALQRAGSPGPHSSAKTPRRAIRPALGRTDQDQMVAKLDRKLGAR